MKRKTLLKTAPPRPMRTPLPATATYKDPDPYTKKRRPGRPALIDKEPKVHMMVSISPDHRAMLLTFSKRTGLSMSALVTQALGLLHTKLDHDFLKG